MGRKVDREQPVPVKLSIITVTDLCDTICGSLIETLALLKD
jgi:hypothetical protein